MQVMTVIFSPSPSSAVKIGDEQSRKLESLHRADRNDEQWLLRSTGKICALLSQRRMKAGGVASERRVWSS